MSERLDLLGKEEEAMSGLAESTQIAAGVVIHGDRQIDLALEVLLDRVNRRGHPIEREVEDVGAAARSRQDAVAGPELGGADVNALHLSPVALWAPTHHT
jgi:hypothetical protein